MEFIDQETTEKRSCCTKPEKPSCNSPICLSYIYFYLCKHTHLIAFGVDDIQNIDTVGSIVNAIVYDKFFTAILRMPYDPHGSSSTHL